MSADPFTDWYGEAVLVLEPAGYGEDGTTIVQGSTVGRTRGQLSRSNQLVRSADGQEVTSSATLAAPYLDAGLFEPGRSVVVGGSTLTVITANINGSDPVLAGVTVYLS